MVFRGEMTTTTRRPERPKTLHNFTLPSLKWGSQRHLTCTKIFESATSSGSGGSGDHRLRRRSPPRSSVSTPFRFGESHRRRNGSSQHRRSRNAASLKSVDDGGGEEEEGEGIEEFRVKIMSDLKTVRDKITRSMYALGERDEEQQRITNGGGGSGQEEKEVSPVKPWNLRKRRAAACKEPTEEERVVNPPPPPSRNDSTRAMKERAETTAAKEMMTRPKFSVNLSKKEIEEDFMAVLGHRPPRRPKKRPRTVQKKLDSLHPAFYLTEVTLDDYKVEETKR
ncbi:hypothetical protein Bca52824_064147 [Brassica carinata]|uniref:Uncharacterized protein n=1 Tax=Brassica carinata TaxID=52824 RepID=A0A8X7QHS0_BRACI|nr:hypothetical protein Bca52824_064147 [Brassica carinata]